MHVKMYVRLLPGLARLLLTGLCGMGVTGSAQNLAPNPSFDAGENQPLSWELPVGRGEWIRSPGQPRALAITGTGYDSGYWQSSSVPLQPGALYEFSFRARRRPEALGGVATAGTSRVHRDFQLTEAWQEYSYVFRQPDDAPVDVLRLGQWHVRGTLEFSHVAVRPVQCVHHTDPDIRLANQPVPLGGDEMFRGNYYRFQPRYSGRSSNFHRPLVRSTARFNTDRWVFGPGAEVTYHHCLPGQTQRGLLEVQLNYHRAGRLLVEASTNAGAWHVLAVLDAHTRTCRTNLPTALLPCRELWVRLRTPDPITDLQVHHVQYETWLTDSIGTNLHGQSYLFTHLEAVPGIELQPVTVRPHPGTGRIDLGFLLRNSSGNSLRSRVQATPPSCEIDSRILNVTPGGVRSLACTMLLSEPGWYPVEIRLVAESGRVMAALRTDLHLSLLDDPRPGYSLVSASSMDVWWCESGWKISRHRAPPARTTTRPMYLQVARREFEAVQIVLRPHSDVTLLHATAVWDLVPDRSAPIPEVNWFEVAYVEVISPTDETAKPGWYPDPLLPLRCPLHVPAGMNQPLWLQIYAPPGCRPGRYLGTVTLEFFAGRRRDRVSFPIQVEIFNFDLPPASHLRSALGFDTHLINQYHKLTRREDQITVYAEYLRTFAEHRISPYSFFDYAPIHVTFEGPPGARRARVDFGEFDAWAERWLVGAHTATFQHSTNTKALIDSRPWELLPALGPRGVPFNSFRLPLPGMGGGTFYSRYKGQLDGHEEGTPEHARLFADCLGQIEAHLRENGWLPFAYTYWFDEPDPKDYAFVVEGQQRIRSAAPGLRRMLTEPPDPDLVGHVDIWCALPLEWTSQRVASRRAAGEEVWWYICTVPKAPYITLFIDHPALELRLWPWQAWQFDIQGILIWSTTYWTSPVAYPDSLQNPWQDTMSWASGYGQPAGTRVPWGNGDGRLLYPPRRDPNSATEPVVEGPVVSCRLANLRDGMEDYEYFWLLREEIRRVESLDRTGVFDALASARAALQVPPVVSRDLTTFTTDPRVLLAHRLRLARAIEYLRNIR
ncbi:MAG: DUF4091 domain-containing protein [Verrucomicrobiota bacterium]|nr:DUF4091 domain-containing protein [Limisphaera sp.]MDW8381583.1 DUF4091 domain-containing protein [Verrucomicrobiota bacterium]